MVKGSGGKADEKRIGKSAKENHVNRKGGIDANSR